MITYWIENIHFVSGGWFRVKRWNMERGISDNDLKERIRKRYKGSSRDDIKVIPAKPVDDIFVSDKHKRVGVYARVSTDDPNQTSSYELQKNFYEDLVKRHPNWELVDIYADEGISGTSLNHRDSFVRMIRDCHNGMLDLIITKSVSRFARNVEDCVHYVRELKRLDPQVGILFETEGIYTLNENSEMQLSFLSTLAQEESHNKSMSMNRSIEMRFERGIFLTPILLGYDHDEDGNLIINEAEAKTVRLIFMMFLAGESCSYIAKTMTEMERTTKKNNKVWTSQRILEILKNERYCGDIRARKTYTIDYLTHKKVKNINARPQYYQENHHDAIISREDFIISQKIIDANKYGYRKASPDLLVVDKGVLRGFVQFNPLWRGYTVNDYIDACQSILSDKDYINPSIKFNVKKGNFNFSSYQVVREQFINNCRKVSVSISIKQMKFSSDAVNELNIGGYIEILYHPLYEMMVVRKGKRDDRHSMKWAVYKEKKFQPCIINNPAFMNILYQFCGWDGKKRYLVDGYLKEQGEDRVLVFFMSEAVIRIKENGKYINAFQDNWRYGFGQSYYDQKAKELSMFTQDKIWNINCPGTIAKTIDFNFVRKSEMKERYMSMIEELKEERDLYGV